MSRPRQPNSPLLPHRHRPMFLYASRGRFIWPLAITLGLGAASR